MKNVSIISDMTSNDVRDTFRTYGYETDDIANNMIKAAMTSGATKRGQCALIHSGLDKFMLIAWN